MKALAAAAGPTKTTEIIGTIYILTPIECELGPQDEHETLPGERTPGLLSVRVVVPNRILLLEDNPFLAPALVRLLKRHSYEVTHVDTCWKARALEEHFDLGVFDIELPDGFGTDLGNDLVGNGTVGSVVFYTATLDGSLFLHAQRIGACIRKSDGLDMLLEAIRSSLRASSRRAAGSGKNGAAP